jgi:hypothetical protein
LEVKIKSWHTDQVDLRAIIEAGRVQGVTVRFVPGKKMVNVRVIVVAARGEPQIVRVVDESFIRQHGYEHSEFLEPVRPTNQVAGREMVDDNHCRFKRGQNGPIRFERLQFRLYSKLPEMMRD